ncbi:MAG: hypothetical protein JW940_11625 [Polyangiaceae bacterium]|nr:hypothetical protein [Polyangiaceae bacterium]
MKGHSRCHSVATVACMLGFAFACSSSQPAQDPVTPGASTTGGESASSTGGGSALSTGGRTGGVLKDGEGGDGTGAGHKGSGGDACSAVFHGTDGHQRVSLGGWAGSTLSPGRPHRLRDLLTAVFCRRNPTGSLLDESFQVHASLLRPSAQA